MRHRTLTFFVLLSATACGSDSSSKRSDGGSAPNKIDASSSKPAADSGVRASDASTKPSPRDSGTSRDGGGGAAMGGTGGGDSDAGKPRDSGTASPGAKTCFGSKPLSAFVADSKLCVYTFAENLGAARGIAFAPNGDLFVSNGGKITVLWDADGDGYSGASERNLFTQTQGLNHGLVFSRDNKYLLASSPSTVYRYKYSQDQRAAEGGGEVLIKGIPGGGGHATRTLAFDSRGRLYVSVGSASNVDSAADDIERRSQIRRFELPASIPQGGIDYATGEVVASGMRNEVGLFVDGEDRLWGVENGRDNLSDDDFGGDIHNDNPGEEINLVDAADGSSQGAKFYGYPSCYSELQLTGGKGRGSQWADETVAASLLKTDAFCSDTSQVHPPAYVMPAHWAPLGIIVYSGRSLPYTGDLIIAAHGSWNRQPANGRVIARAKLEGSAVTAHEVIVGQKGGNGQLVEGTWEIRPVDVRQGPDEAIYVSDDQAGNILKIGYQQ